MVFSWKKIIALAGIAMVSLFSGFGFHAFAQAIPDDLSGDGGGNFGFDVGPTADDIGVSVSPENPGAFTTVSLQLSSDFIDLNRYQINWFVDGKLMETGIGHRSATVKTKNYGQRTTVIITVKLSDTTVQKQIILAPEDMAMLWEAIDSYVPPFYPGKKLPAREALMKIVSIPNFSDSGSDSFASKSGVYNWRRNDLPVGEAGGYGKDSFTFRHNKIRGTEKIEVRATDIGNEHQAIKSMTLSFFDPKILFYEKNGTGLKSLMAKSSLYLQTDATAIIAEPYFFSVGNNNPDTLRLNWTLNGTPIVIGSKNKNTLVVKNPGSAGSATIGLDIEQPTLLFQAAKNAVNVLFNGK